jgi:predicted esterase
MTVKSRFVVAAVVSGAMTLASLAGIASAAEPASAPTVFWHESEIGVEAPESIGPAVGQRDQASGGGYLKGEALTKAGSAVTYQLELPQAIDDAQLIFRYARLHWRSFMVTTHWTVALAGGGETFKGEATFTETKGWGYNPSEWGLTEPVKLGSLKAGKYTLRLSGVGEEHDVLTDGFFIASPNFKITAAELAQTGIIITSDGYVGLQNATTVNQESNPILRLVARGFAKEPHATLAIGKTAESAAPMKQAGTETTPAGAVVMKFELPPKLDDGDYVVIATGQWPQCKLAVRVLLAGQFLATLDQKMHALEAFTTELQKSQKPEDVRCQADFAHLMDYLKGKAELLANTAAVPADAHKQGLAAKEGIRNPEPLVNDMRRALAQGEETMRRLKAGEDPYAGRTGDLRRAFKSAATGELCVYRVQVPDGYDKAQKVPFILMLHGGGGDENTFPTLDNGKAPEMLNSRGYLAASPRYTSGNPSYLKDLIQLIELMRKDYPKIDPARIYCTGGSMGGFASYSLATSHPDLFAAICCVSGTGRPELAEKLKTTPLLILQGEQDNVVSPEGAKRVHARMTELAEESELYLFSLNAHDYPVGAYLPLTLDFFDRHTKKAAE